MNFRLKTISENCHVNSTWKAILKLLPEEFAKVLQPPEIETIHYDSKPHSPARGALKSPVNFEFKCFLVSPTKSELTF